MTEQSVYEKYDKAALAVALVDIDGAVHDLVPLIDFLLQDKSEYIVNKTKETMGLILIALDSVEVSRMGRE